MSKIISKSNDTLEPKKSLIYTLNRKKTIAPKNRSIGSYVCLEQKRFEKQQEGQILTGEDFFMNFKSQEHIWVLKNFPPFHPKDPCIQKSNISHKAAVLCAPQLFGYIAINMLLIKKMSITTKQCKEMHKCPMPCSYAMHYQVG